MGAQQHWAGWHVLGFYISSSKNECWAWVVPTVWLSHEVLFFFFKLPKGFISSLGVLPQETKGPGGLPGLPKRTQQVWNGTFKGLDLEKP